MARNDMGCDKGKIYRPISNPELYIGLFLGMFLSALVMYGLGTWFNLYPKSKEEHFAAQPHTGPGPRVEKEAYSIPLSSDRIDKLYTHLIAYNDLQDYLKIFLPVAITLLGGVGITMAKLFVHKEVREARSSLEMAIKTEIKDQTRDEVEKKLSDWKTKSDIIDSLKKSIDSLEAKTEGNLSGALAFIHYELGSLYWHQKKTMRAIQMDDRAIQKLREIPTEFYQGTAGAPFKQLKAAVVGDLAYYQADLYRQAKSPAQAQSAARFAEELLSLLKERAIHNEDLRMSQIDNYLFVVTNVPTVSRSLKLEGKHLWEDNQEGLTEYLRRKLEEQASDRVQTFTRYFQEIK